MKKCSLLLIVLMLFPMFRGMTQGSVEQAYRIRRSQFPSEAKLFISQKIDKARKLRYYREKDSTLTRYEARFKKDRLQYDAVFNEDGRLKAMDIFIKPVDIPNESMGRIEDHLTTAFVKFRIRRMRQRYEVSAESPEEATLKNCLQNLILPGMKYILLVSDKSEKNTVDYQVVFSARGRFLGKRASLPANYDHVLY